MSVLCKRVLVTIATKADWVIGGGSTKFMEAGGVVLTRFAPVFFGGKDLQCQY